MLLGLARPAGFIDISAWICEDPGSEKRTLKEASVKFPLPVVYAIISYFLYAAMAFILERKLSPFSAPAVLVLQYAAALPLVAIVLVSMKLGHSPIKWPTGAMLWWTLGAGLVFFLADTFMVTAYTTARQQGMEYLFAIVAVGALYPVFASIMKFVWTKTAPNGYYLAAYAISAVVLIMVALGGRLDQQRDAARKAVAAQAHSAAPAPVAH